VASPAGLFHFFTSGGPFNAVIFSNAQERELLPAVLAINRGTEMLRVVSFCILMLTAPTLAAIQNGPIGGKPYSEQMDAANEMFLAELRQRLLQRGYEEVRVVPQMFVVKAMEKGRAVTLIVDSDSLQSLSIGADNKGNALQRTMMASASGS
jgi:hypothetical protein